jgi:hypothetical protein
MTNKGDVLTNMDQTILVDADVDGLEIFFSPLGSAGEEPFFIGPAYLGNFEAF